MDILMVLTSHAELGTTGKKTGFWLEEFAAPYYVFKAAAEAQKTLAHTGKLAEMKATHYDAVFYPGGHGRLWDLAQNSDSLRLIQQMLAADKTVAAVCHAPGVLRRAVDADGVSVVKGKRVTGFANTEEETLGLTQVVPFLVQDMLSEHGNYSKDADWHSYGVTDGALITGQNPASSAPAAQALLARPAKR